MFIVDCNIFQSVVNQHIDPTLRVKTVFHVISLNVLFLEFNFNSLTFIKHSRNLLIIVQ